MDNDTELVERARNGDKIACSRLVEEHKKNVYYLAYDLTRSREDAQDISQDVFLRAFRSMKNFRGDSKFSSWLYRITANACFSLKSNRNYRIMKERDNIEEMKDHQPGMKDSASVSPERKTESGFIQKNIEKALQKLTQREKTVFVMRNYSEMSFDEIVGILKLRPGTVRNLNFKALQKLRKELAFYKEEI